VIFHVTHPWIEANTTFLYVPHNETPLIFAILAHHIPLKMNRII